MPPRPCDFVSLVHDLTPDRSILHAETLPRQGYTAVKIGSDLMVLYRTGDDRGWEDGHGALRTFSRDHARKLIADVPELGRASGRARVWQSVSPPGGPG